MTAYATPADVEAAWRTLDAAERRLAATKLEFASEVIRARVTDLDARITAGTASAALAKHVAVEMVLRHLRNPDGTRQTSTQHSIDDYSETVTETRDGATASGGIYLTDEELSLLTRKGSSAFSIAPTRELATCAMAEQVAANRALWDR